MRSAHWSRSALTALLIAGIVNLGPIASVARAELIATSAVERPDSHTDARSRVEAALGRAEVAEQLEALGIDPDEARARAAGLSDREIAALDARLDGIPSGQSFVGSVLGVAAVALVVLLFLDLLGFTDVFPFIDPLPRGDAPSR